MSTGPFPSSYERRAPTLAELQVEFGAENANSLVSKIGELARAHGLDRSHAGMNGTVDRVIGSLTMDERRLMSQGSYVPPRVDAIISAEADAVKAQQRQNEDAARNDAHKYATIPFGMNAAFGRGGILPGLWNLPGSDGRSGGGQDGLSSGGSNGRNYASLSTQWNPSSGGAGLTQANFGSTPFAGMGLDYGTTKSLFAQGFNERQIKQAANDSKTIGLPPKLAAVDVAHLRKAEGKRTDQHLKSLSDYRHELENIVQQRRVEEAKPDSPQKFENLRRLGVQEKAAEKKQDVYEREKVITPEGRKRYHHLRQMERDQVKLQSKIGDPKARVQDDAHLDKGRQERGHEKAAEAVKDKKLKLASLTPDEKVSDDFLSNFGVSGPTSQKAELAAKADKPDKSEKPEEKPAGKKLAARDAKPEPKKDNPEHKKDNANRPMVTAKLNKSGPVPA